jgi:hypothetical protein
LQLPHSSSRVENAQGVYACIYYYSSSSFVAKFSDMSV